MVTDGKTQSTQFDEFAYHESLVHPALLHVLQENSNVRTVFIGGGGELATAREVLRHKTVEKCVMVDLDAKVVEVSKQHLPEWGGENVTSDPRFELTIGDAYAYLQETELKFDAIIMDISDPIDSGPGIMLYTQEFYQHAASLLNRGGVFVTQGGTAEAVPYAVVNKDSGFDPSCFAPIANTLQTVFDCVIPYTSNIPSFGGDWGFVMAFNVDDGNQVQQKAAWCNPSPGTVDGLVEKYIEGGASSLRFYDGTTHLRMFALTKPLRQYVAQDQRVMTRQNPVFMY